MVSEAIHLDDALKRHIGLGEEALNLDDTLLLHPAIRRVVELLLEHIVEVLNAEATDVGKLLYGLHTGCVVAHERCERLVAVEEVVEGAELNLWGVEELEDYEHLLNLRALQVVTLHRILEVEAHRLQEQVHGLVHRHLSEFVVYLLDLAHNAIEGYHVTRSACSDEVGADDLHIGQCSDVVVVCAEAEYEVSLANGVVATLLRVDCEVTLYEE